MTRERALEELRRLAGSLPADAAGCARLLERVSQSDEAETLRARLVELGAEALLDSNTTARTERIRRAVEKHLERVG